MCWRRSTQPHQEADDGTDNAWEEAVAQVRIRTSLSLPSSSLVLLRGPISSSADAQEARRTIRQFKVSWSMKGGAR